MKSHAVSKLNILNLPKPDVCLYEIPIQLLQRSSAWSCTYCRQVFTCANFHPPRCPSTWECSLVLTSGRSSSASYAWSLSIYFTFVRVLSHSLWLAQHFLWFITCANSLKQILFTSPLKADMISFFPFNYLSQWYWLFPISLISCCEHLTRTTTSLLLCGGGSRGSDSTELKTEQHFSA